MTETWGAHQELANLLRRQAAIDVVVRYATGLDGRDWALFASCFTDPVEIDFSSFSGRPAATVPRERWLAQVRALIPGFTATQHLSTNHVVELRDGGARVVSQMLATHYLPAAQGMHTGEPTVTLGGYYTNDLLDTPEGLRIARCALSVTWRAGNEVLWSLATARASAGRTGETESSS